MVGKHTQRNGFTIVELLIVIVVIGILAAITIVAFNGVQDKAKNQLMVSAVRSYYGALKAYAVENNGALPTNTGCLGSTEVYTSNPCFIGANSYGYTPATNNALAPYLGNTPNVPTGRITSGANSASGIFYYTGGTQYIGFVILSSSSCPTIAGAEFDAQVAYGTNMYCRIKFPTT